MHKNPLNTHAAYSILESVFLYATLLQDSRDHGPHGDALVVLARDAERRIAQVFGQINKQHPGIEIVLPDCDEETGRFFIAG